MDAMALLQVAASLDHGEGRLLRSALKPTTTSSGKSTLANFSIRVWITSIIYAGMRPFCRHPPVCPPATMLLVFFKSTSLAAGLSFYISQLHAYEILNSMHCLTD
ncbi:hypothetical protein SLEP1_g23917 [Rubroshorea leprosula]|uniref:Uncharacterized protein n=1 Tax=Rubroshorea leprosula TaxID=152421 RepID=A0AAV5JPB4_9ROSI|nr:hypothetical protein SLEP1_g23917 [Rubroshorea leprosula]